MSRRQSLLIILMVFVFLILTVNWNRLPGRHQNISQPEFSKYEDEARGLLENNLQAANNEDVESYLQTIASHGHSETKEVMVKFFQDYDVQHELLSFDLTGISEEELTAEARQKTTGISRVEGESYRNHIAEVLLVFIKEEGQWKINESYIADVEFIP